MSSRHRTKAAVVAVVAGLGVLGFAGVASAHHPEVEARALCVAGGQARIVVDTYSWVVDGDARKTNPDVVVTVGGQSRRGAFNAANGFAFQVTFDVPADGSRYVVRSTSVAPWGFNGEWGSAGEYRETTVRVPTSCPDGATSVSTSSTTVPNGMTVATTIPGGGSSSTTTAPSTTRADAGASEQATDTTTPTTSGGSSVVVVSVPDSATKTPSVGIDGGVLTAVPSTIETKVIGTVETRPTVEVQGAVQFQQLPRTGTDPRPYIALGITLATLGVLLDAVARRRRPVDVAD